MPAYSEFLHFQTVNRLNVKKVQYTRSEPRISAVHDDDASSYVTCRCCSAIEHRAATPSAVTRSDVALSTGGVAVISGDADVASDGAPTCRGKNLAWIPNSTRSVPVTWASSERSSALKIMRKPVRRLHVYYTDMRTLLTLQENVNFKIAAIFGSLQV